MGIINACGYSPKGKAKASQGTESNIWALNAVKESTKKASEYKIR